jgi:DNA helicase-2/ATP-dependent DNA helicase PcrA
MGNAPVASAEVIDALPLDQHLQLIACAGAGKTERVARRVVRQLLDPGTEPKHVVACTFNERAAAELKQRIIDRYQEATGSREGLAEMYVGTIHGYCLDLLQRHHRDAVGYRILNQIQQRHLITRSSRKSGLADLDLHRYRNAKDYAELMSIIREADVDTDALTGTDLDVCLQKYLDLLHEKKSLDFSAILSETVGLLEEDELFRDKVGAEIKYLTVDEYQDVNPVQERLVSHLHDLGAHLTVVGDDDQLLYAWRGSSVGNILTFDERYDEVSTERLELNFRSSLGVVELARHVIESNPERLEKTMVSAGNQVFEQGDLEVLEFDDEDHEAAHIAGRIDDLIRRPFVDRPGDDPRGLCYADMAVLVRVKSLIPAIRQALEDREIPYIVGGVTDLFEAPEANAARELFYFLAGESSVESLRAAWKAANLGISEKDLDAGIVEAQSDLASINEGKGRYGIYNLQRSYLDFLKKISLREEKINGESAARGFKRCEVVFYNLGKFSELISDFEQINFQSEPKSKYSSFAGFLKFQAENLYPQGWLENRYVKPNAVQIMTIHQAKGLQWPAVFVPGLTAQRFPPRKPGGLNIWNFIPDGLVRNRSDYEGGDQDERRLLYVALTRAKKFLTVSRAPYRTAKRAWRKPSFLWPEVQASFAALDTPAPAKPFERLEQQRERDVNEIELSFSELKYAFECPYSFKLRFLYGFNPPIAEALGFGRGLHDSLFELHSRALEGEAIDASVIPELVDRHLFLPFAYPTLEADLHKAATERLNAYIDKRGATFDDIEHAEHPVEIELGDGIRVTGRVDLIRRKSTDEVVIIDFKSSKLAQQEQVSALQLNVYALGYEQATGERASEVVVDNLDSLVEQREPVTEDLLEGAKAAIVEAGESMRENKFPRRPSGSGKQERLKTCERCDLEGICGGYDV